MKLFRFSFILLILSFFLSGCTSILDKNNKSGLQVLTNNTTAAIFLNGEYVEKTPFINKELTPGQYLLKIQPDDTKLVSYETTITLRKGLLTVITWKPGTTAELSGGVMYELEKLSTTKQTELSIVSIPDGAVISIDGAEKEFSPLLKTDITPGTHSISMSLPSFEEQNHTVNVVAGHRLTISVTLAKNPVEPVAATVPVVPAITQTATPSASPAITPPLGISLSASNSALTAQKITITSTNFFQNGKEVLRVRDSIGVSGKELGFAEVGTAYPYLGESKDGWFKISFNNAQGWVSSKFAKLQP